MLGSLLTTVVVAVVTELAKNNRGPVTPRLGTRRCRGPTKLGSSASDDKADYSNTHTHGLEGHNMLGSLLTTVVITIATELAKNRGPATPRPGTRRCRGSTKLGSSASDDKADYSSTHTHGLEGYNMLGSLLTTVVVAVVTELAKNNRGPATPRLGTRRCRGPTKLGSSASDDKADYSSTHTHGLEGHIMLGSLLTTVVITIATELAKNNRGPTTPPRHTEVPLIRQAWQFCQ